MQRFGVAGSIVGFLALVCATLPLWLLPAIFPPKPIDHVVADIAQTVRERAIARATGVQHQSSKERNDEDVWYRASSIAAVSLSLLAIALAGLAFLRREDRRYAGCAFALGVAAIALKVALIALGAVVAVLLVGMVLGYLGIGL